MQAHTQARSKCVCHLTCQQQQPLSVHVCDDAARGALGGLQPVCFIDDHCAPVNVLHRRQLAISVRQLSALETLWLDDCAPVHVLHSRQLLVRQWQVSGVERFMRDACAPVDVMHSRQPVICIKRQVRGLIGDGTAQVALASRGALRQHAVLHQWRQCTTQPHQTQVCARLYWQSPWQTIHRP